MPATRSRSKTTRTPAKDKSPTITRFFYEDHLEGHQTPRFTVVAYKHNIRTGETFYGASLFKSENKFEIERSFGKKQNMKRALLSTAQKRLEMKPVHIKMKSGNAKELHKRLRKAVGKYGAFRKE